jgi:hypothetical protein
MVRELPAGRFKLWLRHARAMLGHGARPWGILPAESIPRDGLRDLRRELESPRRAKAVGVCLGLAATGAGIVWPIDRDIGGALFVIGIGVVVVSSIWFVVSRESS